MKYLLGWAFIALFLSTFWGLAAFVLSRDVDTTIIVFGMSFFMTFILAGLVSGAARRMTDGR